MSRINLISDVQQDIILPHNARIPSRLEVQSFPQRYAGNSLKTFLRSLPYHSTPYVVGISLETNHSQEITAVGLSFGPKCLSIELEKTNALATKDAFIEAFLAGKAAIASRQGEEYPNTFTLVGFDMARMVLLVRKHFWCHTRGIDLGTLIAPSAAAPWSPARVIAARVSQFANANRVNGCWDMEETRQSFFLRAWLSYCVGEKCPTEVGAAVPCDTARLGLHELKCLEDMVAEAHQLDQLKPRSMQGEVANLSVRKDGKLELTNDRYKTRVRRSTRQNVVFTTASGEEFSTRAVGMKGRQTTLSATQMRLSEVTGIRVEGRQELTNSERAAEFLLLSILQGIKSFQKSPFIRLFWFPKWKTFKPPDVSVVLNPAHVASVLQQAGLNQSQEAVVRTIGSTERSIIVHGPPGTGKTTTIAAIARIWDLHDCPVWIIAHSNVAVKNIATSLHKRRVDFKIIVAKEFYEEWHEHLYGAIEEKLIRTDELPMDQVAAERAIGDSCIILSTLSTLSNPALDQNGMFKIVPVERLIVDEASQIRIFEFLHLFEKFQDVLEKVYFFGDPCQLPPFNHEKVSTMQTVFDLPHLNTSLRRWLLDTQYRMPVKLGNFISEAIYQRKLISKHGDTSMDCVRFIDVRGGDAKSGRSWTNPHEITTVVHIIEHYYRNQDFAIITPYDAQRGLAENALRANGLPWEDRVFNLDSFQGNERDYIVISLVRTSQTGFLTNLNRLNVLLTRCKKGMVIVTNRDFLHTIGSSILVAKFAAHWKYLHGEEATWVNWKHVAEGSADLPGVLGPNRSRGLQAAGYAVSINYGPNGTTTYARSADARTQIPSRYQGQHGGFDTSKLWMAMPRTSVPAARPASPTSSNEDLFPELIDSLLESRQVPPKAKGNLWSTASGYRYEMQPVLLESRSPSSVQSGTAFPSLSCHIPPKARPSDSRAQRFSLLNRDAPTPWGLRQAAVASSGPHSYSNPRSAHGATRVGSGAGNFTAATPSRNQMSSVDSYGQSQRTASTMTSHSRITFVNNQGHSRTSYIVTSSSFKIASKLNPTATPFESKAGRSPVTPGPKEPPRGQTRVPGRFSEPGRSPVTPGPKEPLREQARAPERFSSESDGWTRVERRKGFGRKSFAEVARNAAALPSRANVRAKGNRYWVGRD